MTAPAASPRFASPIEPAEAGRRLWETLCNVALAVLFLRFAMLHGQTAYHTLRLSSFLLLAKVTIDVYFFLTRSLPKGVSLSIYDWFIGITGTFLIVLFQSSSQSTDHWLGHTLQFAGMFLQLAGILSLNKSFGIVAANRGVKTSGMYRFVRHPLYFSYAIAYAGYILNHPTNWNFMIYAASFTLWALRLIAEERFLMQDEEYREYALKVRSRLIPGIF